MTTTTTVLLPFVQNYPGEPVPEENHLLGFMVQGKITEADAPTVRLDVTPFRLSPSPPFLCQMPFLLQPSRLTLA